MKEWKTSEIKSLFLEELDRYISAAARFYSKGLERGIHSIFDDLTLMNLFLMSYAKYTFLF